MYIVKTLIDIVVVFKYVKSLFGDSCKDFGNVLFNLFCWTSIFDERYWLDLAYFFQSFLVSLILLNLNLFLPSLSLLNLNYFSNEFLLII